MSSANAKRSASCRALLLELSQFAPHPRLATMSRMQWLVHGTLSPAVADALKRHGHQTHGVQELSLAADAPHLEVLKAAQKNQWDVMTNDPNLVNAPFEHDFYFNRSVVFLQLEGQDVEQDDAVDRLFERYKRLTPKRLYTVTGTRVKIRQLPGA